ncbi:hypothetical protein [Kitasatospora viridis]|uniref:Uncharacterized protein n=1 Tax=Kitasatospora viridis TaxID=281105 RepID=A0A561UHT6_9ACTN|nr:hypothetical protein [Kitasatospora viridis]TWF98905.1 hypothetical protein FHX73_112734 [Kitasatospora viridis]
MRRAPRSRIRVLVAAVAVGAALALPVTVAIHSASASPSDINWNNAALGVQQNAVHGANTVLPADIKWD